MFRQCLDENSIVEMYKVALVPPTHNKGPTTVSLMLYMMIVFGRVMKNIF